jgi:protein arginine kinase
MTFSCPAARPVAEDGHPEFDVVVRSYVSAERNLKSRRFPHALPKAEAAEIGSSISAAARSCGFEVARIVDLDPWTRSNLAERELFSRPYLLDEDKFAALSPDAPLWLAVNDSSHVSSRASRPGLDLNAAWLDVSAADDSLAGVLGDAAWAFDPSLGYIMPEASFCGSGLAARVTIHAPALVVSGLAETAFKRAMEAGFVVAGAYSSVGSSGGALFDLTLPPVYRDPERAALSRLESAARALADYERRAREQLLSRSPWDILDVIGRAAGRATGSRLVSRDEAADIVSGLRLGLACGVLEGMGLGAVTDLWPSLRVRLPAGTSQDQTRTDDAAPSSDEPEAAARARALRNSAAGIRFSQRYKDV